MTSISVKRLFMLHQGVTGNVFSLNFELPRQRKEGEGEKETL